MLKDLFRKFIEVVGVADDKKPLADKFIAELPEELSKPEPSKPAGDKPLTAEDISKIIAESLAKQAAAFNAEIEKIRSGQTSEKVEAAIQKLITEKRLAPKDELGLKSARELLAANYESGLAVLNKLPQIAPEKPAPDPDANKSTEAAKNQIRNTAAGRSLDEFTVSRVASIPSQTI